MDRRFDFSGQAVFVAGGTSGINLAIALAFARAGARVGVVSRSAEKVERAVGELESAGAQAFGRAVDVRQPDALADAIGAAADALGDFDVVVSGAAGNFPAPALGMSSNAFKSVVDIDLLGSFNVARHAYARMKKPGSCLINISAPQAWAPTAFQVHVCAAKAGVDMITRVLAMEWGPAGVRVVSIAPGPIEGTEGMQRLAGSEQARVHVQRSVPLRRFGTVDDIAQAALFLASPWASFISGAVLPVDGGWSLGGSSGFLPH